MHHRREVRWLLVVLSLLFASRAALAQQQGYAGSAVCVDCEKEVTQFGATIIGRFCSRARGRSTKLGCEACHGPAKEHGSPAARCPARWSSSGYRPGLIRVGRSAM
jgi:hypothetical protein